MSSTNIFSVLIVVMFLSSGCSSLGRKLKSLVSGAPEPQQASRPLAPSGPSFSRTPNMMVGKERIYRRVTKENFSDEQSLEDNSGSLWKKVGQGSYLFSQNNLRMMGDIINVEVEGKAEESLSAKVTVIKKAWARMGYAGDGIRSPASKVVGKVPKPEKDAAPAAAAPPLAEKSKEGEETDNQKPKEMAGSPSGSSRFDNVPCRIVERNTDGSYRVKGQQTIYVGAREYKLLVTGLVRPDDISSDVVGTSKLIDSKIDLVASMKETKNEIAR